MIPPTKRFDIFFPLTGDAQNVQARFDFSLNTHPNVSGAVRAREYIGILLTTCQVQSAKNIRNLSYQGTQIHIL